MDQPFEQSDDLEGVSDLEQPLRETPPESNTNQVGGQGVESKFSFRRSFGLGGFAPQVSPLPQSFVGLSEDEVRRIITRVDRREKRIGIAGAIIMAVLALLLSVPHIIKKSVVVTPYQPIKKICPMHYQYVTHSGQSATCNGILPASYYIEILVVFGVLAIGILLAVRFQRRHVLAIVLAVAGIATSTILFVALFVGAAIWLMIRAYRTQKYGSPTAKVPVEGYVRPNPKRSRRSEGASSRTSHEKKEESPPASPSPVVAQRPPAPSKRYTPKAPPKKKPPLPE